MKPIKKKIKQRKKNYREDNKEAIKQYREDNKEAIKQHYEENKEAINEKKRQKINCVCGKITDVGHKKRHEQTKKHIEFIQQQNKQ